MLISVNWLRKYLPEFQVNNVDKFRYRVDTRLSEVAEVTTRGQGLSSLVTAEILSANPHPKSTKLQVCEVSTGDKSKPRTIVCGAPNARAGLTSVLCLPEGSVYDHATGENVTIGEREVMGVMSQGMLCSPAELGLSQVHDGIIELPTGTQLGEDVTHLFRDTVIEIENKSFPHRPDVFSHLGIAREFAAIFKTVLIQEDATKEFIARAEAELPISVDVKDTNFCPRFSVVTLSNVIIKPSPLWLQIALSYCGVRPINNVVDITNYVMLDIGQPMHGFDYDKVTGHKLTVRKAEDGEMIKSLDGKERKLTSSMTVISDGKQAQSIAGIMGGSDSEISDTTTHLVLEAANWEMYQIRRTSRDLGLRTEASTRYEKGLSASTTVTALVKAANMLLDIAGAEVASELTDIYPNPEIEKEIEFDLNAIPHLLGVKPTKAELLEILESIGLEVIGAEKIPAEAFTTPNLKITIRVPLYRRDLRMPADILEEVGRYFGYENFPMTLPQRNLTPAPVNAEVRKLLGIKKLIASSGLNEIYTYSMVGDSLYKKALLNTKGLWEIQNPISPELKYVRQSVVPSLIEKAQINSNKYQDFGLFEISRVAMSDLQNDLPKQPHVLAGVFVAEEAEMAYRHLKLSLENLSHAYADQITLTHSHKDLPEYLHPGKSGEIKFADEVAGHIGIVHPLVIENFELGKVGVATFELNLEKLLAYQIQPEPFKQLSKYPAVIRDFSFWKAADRELGELITKIKNSGISALDSVTIIDTFGKGERTSFTIRVVFQPMDHTLTQAEITGLVEQINAQAKQIGLETRS